ncbi:B3/B4 domain-containing protein [Aggregatilinea lenta]|uniref:B3/B4 domain-containing protein n=1 Tax=Aggregatilinea lenta TaxID=913108 RepID=UPI000E5BA430|nr:phenylalanine--tRNA ligase beta subunit-related protein [Aggregatilinea lenta]
MLTFRYDDDLLARYPAIRGGVILARNLHNGPTPPDLIEAYLSEQRATNARIGDTPLSQIPSLAAWRRAFSAFGVEPTKYRNAAESLLRRLTKQGNIPSINMLVDLENMISIRYGLPVAFFDERSIHGSMTVRFATGDENFTDLGELDPVHPAEGEVIFVDETGQVNARRWCWRQSEQSAARDDTTGLLITIEGLHEDAEQDVQSAVDELQTLLVAYIPEVDLQAKILSPDDPMFTEEPPEA